MIGIIRLYLTNPPPAVFPLELKWQTELGSSTYDRPVYQDGLVLFPANGFLSSRWYGLEAATGEVVWSQRVRRNSYLRCLTKKYLVVSGNQSLVALNASNGKIVWAGERAYTATCSEDTVFYSGVPRDTVHAVSIPDGRGLWSLHDEMRVHPKLDGFTALGEVTYDTDADKLIAGGAVVVDPIPGKIIRIFEPSFVGYAPGKIGRGLVVNRGELFIGGTVLDAQTGEIIHKEEHYSTNFRPTLTEDTMYLSSRYEVVAFDRADYNVKWVYSPEKSAHVASPVITLDGIGYVIYSDITLRAIDLETGQELGYWQPEPFDRFFWPLGGVQPTGAGVVASEGILFVSFGDGKLYAFE